LKHSLAILCLILFYCWLGN